MTFGLTDSLEYLVGIGEESAGKEGAAKRDREELEVLRGDNFRKDSVVFSKDLLGKFSASL